jgi:tellurite resistance protein TerC
MYFMLAAAAAHFKYLKYGLSLVLVFIGAKIIWNFGLSKELGWVPYLAPQWALLVTLVLIGGAIAYSALHTRRSRMRQRG